MASKVTNFVGWIKRQAVAVVVLCIALVLVPFFFRNWKEWASNGDEQKTDDAYVRADVTPLSTKVAGLVASSYKATADLLQAQLANLLAQAELQETIGRTPGE